MSHNVCPSCGRCVNCGGTVGAAKATLTQPNLSQRLAEIGDSWNAISPSTGVTFLQTFAYRALSSAPVAKDGLRPPTSQAVQDLSSRIVQRWSTPLLASLDVTKSYYASHPNAARFPSLPGVDDLETADDVGWWAWAWLMIQGLAQ